MVIVRFADDSNCRKSVTNKESPCLHIGSLVHDGYNYIDKKKIPRLRCTKCHKRFGSLVNPFQLLEYQTKLRQLIYDLFWGTDHQTNLEKSWGIPQNKLSRFKKDFVAALFQQYPRLLEDRALSLPKGVMIVDETYKGTMKNSNGAVAIINENFQTLATGPTIPNNLSQAVKVTFNKIPSYLRSRLRILIADGEPAYETTVMNANARVIHVQQLHTHKNLGKVVLSKYEKCGPHYLHYQIFSHWKIFKKGSHELKFRWCIKWIHTAQHIGIGRWKRRNKNLPIEYWRRKYIQFQSPSFKKKGTAKVYINMQTRKISMRAGASRWMIRILQPLLKIFQGKCITSNKIESKNSQVKRKGARRKQQDGQYGDQMHALCSYLAEQHKLPEVTLAGRPLFKYLNRTGEQEKRGYVEKNKVSIITQELISSYIE